MSTPDLAEAPASFDEPHVMAPEPPPLPGTTPYRHMPYDIDVEQALLGAMLVNRVAFFSVTETIILTADHFYDALHGRMWLAMSTMFERDAMVNPTTMHAAMKSDPGVIETGGMAYFEALASAAPGIPNVKEYARIIIDLATRRRLIQVGEDIVNLAYEPPTDETIAEIADRAGEQIYETAHTDQIGSGPEDLIDVVDRAIKLAEDAQKQPERARILTGLPSVDKALGGLFPAALTVLAAAPSMGKSGLGAQFGITAARHIFPDLDVADPDQGYSTLVFSKEMGAEEFVMRYIAQETGVPANRIEEGRITDAEFERIVLSREKFMGLPYKIDASTSLTVAQMRARAQAVRRRRGRLDLVIVDHLRFVQAANPRVDEKQQLQQVTRDLKALAKDMRCAVLLIAHLNRDFWKRTTQRPVISDIYGSAAVEQNADHIWFLHREEYYLDRTMPDTSDAKNFDAWAIAHDRAKGKAEIFSAKRRGGPVGSATVDFDGPMVRFTDPTAPAPASGGGDAEPMEAGLLGYIKGRDF